MALGNVVGSNIFNILGILGRPPASSPRFPSMPPWPGFDIPFMLVVSLALAALIVIGGPGSAALRGLLMLGVYVGYVVWLF